MWYYLVFLVGTNIFRILPRVFRGLFLLSHDDVYFAPVSNFTWVQQTSSWHKGERRQGVPHHYPNMLVLIEYQRREENIPLWDHPREYWCFQLHLGEERNWTRSGYEVILVMLKNQKRGKAIKVKRKKTLEEITWFFWWVKLMMQAANEKEKRWKWENGKETRGKRLDICELSKTDNAGGERKEKLWKWGGKRQERRGSRFFFLEVTNYWCRERKKRKATKIEGNDMQGKG